MKTRKRERIVVLSLLICAALMLMGCHQPIDDDPGTTEPPPGNGEPPPPPMLYDIRFPSGLSDGTIKITPASYQAKANDPVTIELIPDRGYEPIGLRVTDVNNHPIDLTPDVISNVYNYSFTMAASPVTVNVSFVSLTQAIRSYNGSIDAANSWEEMNALNELIQKAPDQNNGDVTTAERTLFGQARVSTDAFIGDAPGSSNPNTITTASLNGLFRRYQASPLLPGIIRTKIRNADLKTWFPTITRWPSPDPMVKGVDLILVGTDATVAAPNLLTYRDAVAGPPAINYYPSGITTVGFTETISDSLGTDLTILYYVKSDYPTIPDLNPGKGWEVGDRAIVSARNNPDLYDTNLAANANNVNNPVFNIDGITEIPLVFQVGIDNTRVVNYRIWMWPVAQYTIQYEGGATGAVTLQDYEIDGVTGVIPAAGGAGVPPVAPFPTDGSVLSTNNNTGWKTRGPLNTLNTTNSQAWGLVGKVPLPDSAATPPTPRNADLDRDREVLVEVRTTRANVLISVLIGSSPVRDKDGVLLTNISSTNPGYFYPTSAQYTIRVRSSTPPTGF